MDRRLRQWLLIGVMVAVASPAGDRIAGQVPVARADAAISGVVIDATTKRPIADAVVQLGSVSKREYPEIQQRQFSDSQGRFAFTDLPASPDYTITVTKPGYFSSAYGRSGCAESSFGRIAVIAGGWFRDATVRMCRPGSLSGLVIDERGEPVVGVYVKVLLATRVAGHDRYAAGPLTMTDDRGLYRFGMLNPGRYVVMVPSVQSALPAATSAATTQGVSAQSVANLQAQGRALPPGDPMMEVEGGVRVGVGGYPVPPPPTNGRRWTYPMAFSGGTVSSEVAPVALRSGEDRAGVDIRINPVAANRISGVVQGPAAAGTWLRLLAEGAEDLGPGGETATTLVATDGTFMFANVPDGRYTIEAPTAVNRYYFDGNELGLFFAPRLPNPPGGVGVGGTGNLIAGAPSGVGFWEAPIRSRTYWARTSVTLAGRDATDVVMALRPLGSISGRLAAEAAPGLPAPSPPLSLRLESATGAVWEGMPRSVAATPLAPGEFHIDGVLPGLYVFRVDAAPWLIKSVLVDGRDSTYTPLDTRTSPDLSGIVITFINAPSSLTGSVRETAGAVAGSAAVIAFPIEPDQWTNFGFSAPRVKTAVTSSTGTFRIPSLPAGEYFVVSVPAGSINAWHEPGFFESARTVATRVSLGWGETKAANLTVVNVQGAQPR